MGYGLLNKIILQFPPTTRLPAAIADQDVFYLYTPDVANEKRKFFEWVNYERVVPGSNALVGLISGSFAEAAENGTGVVDAALSILQAAFPDWTAPAASEVTSNITRWRSDPWSRGAYSFIAPGADPTAYETLGKGVDGWLFFAGEHTNKTYTALVHGALGSGRKAAEDMVAQTPIVGPTATATATNTVGLTTLSTTSSKPSAATGPFFWMHAISLVIAVALSAVML
jgi:lysine-specific histone demethylase 1